MVIEPHDGLLPPPSSCDQSAPKDLTRSNKPTATIYVVCSLSHALSSVECGSLAWTHARVMNAHPHVCTCGIHMCA